MSVLIIVAIKLIYWLAGPLERALPRADQCYGVDLGAGLTTWLNELHDSSFAPGGFSLDATLRSPGSMLANKDDPSLATLGLSLGVFWLLLALAMPVCYGVWLTLPLLLGGANVSEVAAAVLKSSASADKHLAEAVVLAAQEKLGITPVGYLTKEAVAELVRAAMRDHPELQQVTSKPGKEVRLHLEATLGDLSEWKDQIYDAYVDFLTAAPEYSGEVVTLRGETGPVTSVAAAPDGRIITSSRDGMKSTVKVWLRDPWPEPERTIETDHGGGVNAMAVLPGGVHFVSGSWDETAKLWTLDGALERTFEVGYPVLSVAALPDGLHLVIGTGREPSGEKGFELRLYQVDGPLVHTFTEPTGSTNLGGNVRVAVTRDGEHIISGLGNGKVKVWSVATKSLVSTCTGHSTSVEAVEAMPDGQRILSSEWYDTRVRVWLIDGTLENTFFLHTATVNAIVALPDNQCALCGSRDKTIRLFNVNDGVVQRIFPHHTNIVCCLALLPDGLRFVSGSEDNTACIAYHS